MLKLTYCIGDQIEMKIANNDINYNIVRRTTKTNSVVQLLCDCLITFL